MSASLPSCATPYCSSARTSSTRMALAQRGVVDLARAARRQPLDPVDVERARVDVHEVGEVRADLARVDRVEVDAQPEHLRDPRRAAGDDEEAVVVAVAEVARA